MEEADTLNIKFGFSLLMKFSPLYYQKTYHLLNFKRDLATETNADNDFTTVIHIVIILCFIEHLCYQQGPAEMFGNVFILMECYLKLGQMLIIVILLVMSAASKLVGIASKLDWYSEAKTEA